MLSEIAFIRVVFPRPKFLLDPSNIAGFIGLSQTYRSHAPSSGTAWLGRREAPWIGFAGHEEREHERCDGMRLRLWSRGAAWSSRPGEAVTEQTAALPGVPNTGEPYHPASDGKRPCRVRSV